jgi:hypothetical protein
MTPVGGARDAHTAPVLAEGFPQWRLATRQSFRHLARKPGLPPQVYRGADLTATSIAPATAAHPAQITDTRPAAV